MKRLFFIEWYKLKNHSPFWIFAGLHILILLLIFLSAKFFLDFLASKGEMINKAVDPAMVPVFVFPDIWHNMTYIAGFLKIIPAIYVIISVCNEISYGTMRQNIMNGLSRGEFMKSKFFLILILSLSVTLFLLVAGLTLGFIYTREIVMHYIIKYSGFLAAYFLQVTVYQLIAFLLALLIKRTGLTMGLLIIYTYIVEPIIVFRIKSGWIKGLFPLKAINNLIRFPFGRYMFRETQDYVAIQDLSIVLAYAVLFIFLIYLVLRKRDL
jgi:ABC-type transport system involved in multi-copper enzyme maturation permease subunit